MKMKEQTYGWYPPARSIWDRPRALPNYETECLYKHGSSRYSSQPGLATPKPPSAIRPNTPTPARSPCPGRPSSVPAQTYDTDLTVSGFRAPSVGTLRRRSATPCGKPPTSHQKPWAMRLASTEIKVPHFSTIPGPPSQSRISVEVTPVGPRKQDTTWSPPESVSCGGSPSRKTGRVKSATSTRPKVRPPPRPTRSAGPFRGQQSPIPEPTHTKEPSFSPSLPMSSQDGTTSGPPHDERHLSSPVESSDSDDDSDAQTDVPVDFEEEREKHGWKFEIPGDPLNLKTPCLARRLPYTVSLPVPRVAPNPPRGHMMNYETFFLNTIPRKPLSFTIHQDWSSEVLHAKRVELQKRHGMDYNFKQYAFVY